MAELNKKKRTHQVKRACTNCKKSHTKCDTFRPCSRCENAGKICEDGSVKRRKVHPPPKVSKPSTPSPKIQRAVTPVLAHEKFRDRESSSPKQHKNQKSKRDSPEFKVITEIEENDDMIEENTFHKDEIVNNPNPTKDFDHKYQTNQEVDHLTKIRCNICSPTNVNESLDAMDYETVDFEQEYGPPHLSYDLAPTNVQTLASLFYGESEYTDTSLSSEAQKQREDYLQSWING
eukprot:TRINITY_DN5314_c0_g1_i1.p1 TRINITY_DN5314_c0_g1~~TRINITY_DN5314_c0_g1_i1.p1  ORF type:complete len:233 (-),score=41.34 TRINITY_DN5314_c0_g1_i1:65-763(-)